MNEEEAEVGKASHDGTPGGAGTAANGTTTGAPSHDGPPSTGREVVTRRRKASAEPVLPDGLGDAPANPVDALLDDYRRTAARVAYLSRRVDELSDEELVWGVTKTEDIAASEFPGMNITHEARVHVYVQLLDRERKHLLEVEKLMASRRFKAAAEALQAENVEYLYRKSVEIIEALGHDPNDPEVRERVGRVFAPQPDAEHEIAAPRK